MKLTAKLTQLQSAINLMLKRKDELQEQFVFHAFFGDTPVISIDGDLGVNLTYGGYSMDIETAVSYMEDVGYITPDNFYEY